MTKVFHLLVFFALIMQPVFCTDSKTVILQTIKKKVAAINDCKDFEKKTKTADGFPVAGQKVSKEFTAYRHGRKIEKISERINSLLGQAINEFYYEKCRVLYISLREEISGSKGIKADGEGRYYTAFSGQYYFDKGRLIEFRESGDRTFREENDSSDQVVNLSLKEKALKSEARHLLKLLKK